MTGSPTSAWRRRTVTIFAILAFLVAAAAWVGITLHGEEQESPMTPMTISAADLGIIDGTNVFFGHQSVGMNILDGIPTVYQERDVAPPTIVETDTAPTGPAIAHTYIGENTRPDLKMADFTALLADGLGQWADVAFFKMCYLDVTATTDVMALFEQYKRTMSELETTYSDTTFLYVTVPLTTEPRLKERVKGFLGRPSGRPADNAARERFNALLRQEYGDTGRIFDLAAIESTTPDGSRVTGTVDGTPYYALYRGYATDEGHLTPAASAMVAERLLELIAEQRH